MDANQNGTLKITLLTTSFPRHAGDFAGNFVYQYARQLTRIGFKVNVIAPQDSQGAPPDEWCEVEVDRFQYSFPQSFQTLAYGAGMVSRIKQNPFRTLLIPFFLVFFFLSVLRASRNSDLLQAYWLPAGIVALAVKCFKKMPVALTLWGSDFLLLRIPGLAFLLKVLIRSADAVICESDHFKNLLLKLGIPDHIISVLPNGIDLENFQPGDGNSARRQLDLPENKTIILNIGGMSPVKGQRYLIEAIPEIIKREANIQFIFVGDGETRHELETLVNAKTLSPYVLFTGMLKASEIPIWLHAADIFVLPSLSEGNPNVLLEAMACGIPVVATTVGGIPEMIRDGQEGFLVQPKSSEELARQITALIRDKTLREAMGQNGIKTVQAEYATWEMQSAKLKTIYENLTVK
ncbi:MAG: glycosyl transferase family 1 [Nitrospinaceae bacterium]|nr:MAG: glycosyl transferase family 1 [Nitrospinaceae bacterium]